MKHLAPWFAVLAGLAFCACRGLTPSIESEADRRVPNSALLLDRLAEGSLDERLRAARAIARIQSPAYIDGLTDALGDDELEVRDAALFALGQLGLFQNRAVDPRAAGAVGTMLAASEPSTLRAAVDALGKLAGVEAAPRIAGFLAHEDPGVRAEAAYALFRLRFAPLWRGEADEPPVLPDAAVEPLIAATQDPDRDVRFAATYAFSRYGDERAREALVRVSSDDDPMIRLFAVRGLGHVADDSVLAALVDRFGDDHAGVRAEAVAVIGRAGALGPVLHALDEPDESFHVRAAIAGSLRNAEPTALERYVQDPSPTVRVAAIDAWPVREAPGPLEQWSASEDWRIRAAAARATGRAGDEALAKRLFLDDDIRVKTAVLDGLEGAALGDSIVTSALVWDDLALRGTAVGLVAEREHLDRVELLAGSYNRSHGDEWIEVREAIIDVLADIEGGEKLLRHIADNDDKASVRGRAAAALGEQPPAEPPLPVEKLSRWIGPLPPTGVQVDLETRHGTMRIEILSEEAPIHAAAFLDRVDAGFYDGLIWHRVVSNFVIQGGDPRGDGWGGGGEILRDEINTVRFARGMVGMPKAGKDTGGCQLFITHVPTPHLDGNYTIFGRVITGLEVIDAIEVGDEIVRIRRVGAS